jgi:hypothetical protein
MTGNAVVPFMAGKAGFVALSGIVQAQVRCRTVIYDPVSPVRIRPGKWGLALQGPRVSGLDDFSCLRDRRNRYQRRCSERKQVRKNIFTPRTKSHSASPL